MKKIMQWAIVAILNICSVNVSAVDTTTINYRLVSADEARTLIQSNTDYYSKMTQMDIDWRMRKNGSTQAEMQTKALQQTLDWNEAERDFIATVVGIITDSLRSIGYRRPILSEIIFAKTTQEEEGGSAAYTVKNQIFLGETYVNMCMPKVNRTDEENLMALMSFTELIAHEVFHCFSRNSPEFRRQMYSLIGFTVLDHDIIFPDTIRQRIAINPDVERIDNYAEFTINGEKRCYVLVLLYDKSWAEAHAERGNDINFFEFVTPYLVSIDDMTKIYNISEASDFWEIVGRNTDYVFAAEECMADNFSYALIRGINPKKPYNSPELIRNIIATLKLLPNRESKDE